MPPAVPDEDASHEGTPSSFATPQLSADSRPISPTQEAGENAGVDPLVARAAQRIATVINDFKTELDRRDTVWGTANGTFELALNTDGSQVYELTIVHDEDGEEYPVTVRAQLKKEKEEKEAPNGHPELNASLAPLITSTPAPAPAHERTRRDSDDILEKDIVSRKKRKADGGDDQDDDATSRKRIRTDDAMDQDMMPMVSQGNLEDLLTKFRDDIQDDTAECVNHVQKLLRRFKEEWHERTKWEDEQASTRKAREPFRDSIGGANSVAFPSPGVGRDDQNASTADVVRRESKLLSSQIRWVEECRRVAASIHDKREENWRTTSAGFHDRNRHDREAFQHRMLHESGVQGKMLNQILNEVKAIGLYTQSMKWETPDSMSQHPGYPPQPMVPAFPTQAPPSGAGRGRGQSSKR